MGDSARENLPSNEKEEGSIRYRSEAAAPPSPSLSSLTLHPPEKRRDFEILTVLHLSPPVPSIQMYFEGTGEETNGSNQHPAILSPYLPRASRPLLPPLSPSTHLCHDLSTLIEFQVGSEEGGVVNSRHGVERSEEEGKGREGRGGEEEVGGERKLERRASPFFLQAAAPRQFYIVVKSQPPESSSYPQVTSSTLCASYINRSKKG